MRGSLLFCILFPGAFLCFAQPPKDKLERLMEGYAANNGFNGVVFVAKKGAVVLEKGYGFKEAGKPSPHTENSIFRIGRVSEIIAAEVILQLDSKGRLGLDDQLVKYLPDYTNGWKITLRNLLTHTSGIYDYSRDTTLLNIYADKPIKKETILAAFKDRPLQFDPGTRYEYSASDYFLLGCVVEQIMKWGYTDQVRDKILQVCAMRSSGFDYTHLVDDNKSIGYNIIENDIKAMTVVDSSALYGWGDIYSTAGDLYKFHQALHWYKLLPQDWQEIVYAPYKGQQALGWKIEKVYNKRFMEQGGTMPGFSAMVMRQEEDDLFIALLENNGNPGVPLNTIAAGILKTLYGPEPKKMPEKKASEKKEAPVNTDALKKYVGEFDFSPAFYLIFSIAGNELVAESPEQKSLQMVAEGQNVFSIKGAAAKVEFLKDKSGKINKVILHQNGQDVPGERIVR